MPQQQDRPPAPLDVASADWNDRMYGEHPTPYEKGLAGKIQLARVRAVIAFCEPRPEEAVLELGCESGHLIANMPSVRRLVGGDISRRALDDAQALFRKLGRSAEFLQLDARRPLPFSPGEFDVIICSEMLEHVDEPRAVLQSIHSLASDRSRIVLTVPIEAPKVKIKAWLRRVGLLGLLFPGIEEGQSEWHLQAFSPKMLREMTSDLFELRRGKIVWGCHYVALFAKK